VIVFPRTLAQVEGAWGRRGSVRRFFALNRISQRAQNSRQPDISFRRKELVIRDASGSPSQAFTGTIEFRGRIEAVGKRTTMVAPAGTQGQQQ